MDNLSGCLRAGADALAMSWPEDCAPVRAEEKGTEAIVLGAASRRRDDLARRLARNPENVASALASVRSGTSGFAFALWDPSKKRVSLGCDPLGLQPLYIREAEEETFFGTRLSEIAPENEKKLHLASCQHFLSFLSCPFDKCLLGGVRRVPPGTLYFSSDKKGIPATIFPLRHETRRLFPESAKYLRETLQRSVQAAAEGVPEGEPIGIFLSGGFDSTALLAMLRSVREGLIVAIYVGASGNPDREFAREMAEHYKAEFLESTLSGQDAKESLAWIVATTEMPSGNASALATSRALTLARAHGLKRVLSGLGSDKLFCGHTKHILAPWWPWATRLPGPVRSRIPFPASGPGRRAFRRALAAEGGAPEMHRAMYSFFGEGEIQHLRGALALFSRAAPSAWRHPPDAGFPATYSADILQLDLNIWLRAALAPLAGTLAAANGIELVLPFCSGELIAASASMPLKWKVRGRQGKRILQKALSGIVPEKIRARPRQGFTVPVGEWLRKELADEARELLSPRRAEKWSLIDTREITRLLEDHLAGRGDWGLPLWGWMTFSVWYEQFVDPGGGG